MLMAKLFQELSRHGKKNFEVVFLVMNPGYNEINYQTIKDNAKILNVPITVFESDIFNIVASEEQSPCYLCARMRRGYLYSKAKELGCNKIALSYDYDDVIETILMGMLYGAQVQRNFTVQTLRVWELIRPLYDPPGRYHSLQIIMTCILSSVHAALQSTVHRWHRKRFQEG